MYSIHLNKLRFHSFHGLYKEEKVLGNEIEMNITVRHHPNDTYITVLSQTIDYIAVYHLVKERMKQPTGLLETLAADLCNMILENFSKAEEVFISINKLHPPVVNFEGSVGVSFEKKRNSN